MSIPTELGVMFTPTEIADMRAAASLIATTIRSKKAFNMSNDERENKLNAVSDEREPYVRKSIGDYAPAYPGLNGQAYPIAMAKPDLDTYDNLFEVKIAVTDATEALDEMRMVAGHFCYKFMGDQYYNAKRYLGDNVPGAQIVYDGLKGCFEGQGGSNPAPPKPSDPIDNTPTP